MNPDLCFGYSLVVLFEDGRCVLCVLVTRGQRWEYFVALGASVDFVGEFVGGAVQPIEGVHQS